MDTGKLGPEFQVRAEDAPDVVFRASTASSVWKKVLQRIKSTSKDIAVSGPMVIALNLLIFVDFCLIHSFPKLRCLVTAVLKFKL